MPSPQRVWLPGAAALVAAAALLGGHALINAWQHRQQEAAYAAELMASPQQLAAGVSDLLSVQDDGVSESVRVTQTAEAAARLRAMPQADRAALVQLVMEARQQRTAWHHHATAVWSKLRPLDFVWLAFAMGTAARIVGRRSHQRGLPRDEALACSATRLGLDPAATRSAGFIPDSSDPQDSNRRTPYPIAPGHAHATATAPPLNPDRPYEQAAVYEIVDPFGPQAQAA